MGPSCDFAIVDSCISSCTVLPDFVAARSFAFCVMIAMSVFFLLEVDDVLPLAACPLVAEAAAVWAALVPVLTGLTAIA